MLKINSILTSKDIFDFLYPQFNTVRAKSNGNDVHAKEFRAVALVRTQLFSITYA